MKYTDKTQTHSGKIKYSVRKMLLNEEHREMIQYHKKHEQQKK